MIKRIGRYEVQAELGHGGFGQVYRAYDPNLDALVAIKKLKADSEADLIRRFRNEAASARKLRHQNIVTIYDFGEEAGSPYLVMELLEGEDLERIIKSQRALTLLQRLDIMMQIAAGLHHAHKNGVVHRDVKPANIMLLRDGTVKIVDFGIALLTQASAIRETPAGAMLGTFGYMAPEHLIPPRVPSDALTDIFAYGVTCYKLLTGFHPFPSSDIGELMDSIIHKKPAPVRKINPQCPELLEEAVAKMLAKERDARYQSLEDVRFDLAPIILDLEKERVEELLTSAKVRIEDEDFETAQELVRQALEIDSGNRTARELREWLRKEIENQVVRPRIAALVSEGREQLQARQFDQAIQKFESALRLEKSNPEIHALLDRAREAWQKAQRAERLVQEANRALERGDLTAAHQNAAEALSADPQHGRAAPLLQAVRERIETRNRERQLRDGLSQGKGLILLQNFEKAIEVLGNLRSAFPEADEVSQLLERARKEQELQARRERLAAGAEEAKELLRNRRFSEAVERLTELQAEFPESPELRDLNSYAVEELRAKKQADDIALATSQARSLMQEGKFDAALERLRSALAEYPGASALRDLVQSAASAKAEHQRKTALDEAMRQSAALLAENRFAETLERIHAFERAYGDTTTIQPLRKQADEGLERQRREAAIRKVILDAKTLLDDGRTDSATEVLQQGTMQFPEHEELAQLLGVAREQQRVEAVSNVIAEAESLARAHQFDRALEMLDGALQQHPGDERLRRCHEATIASRAAYQRELARQQTLNRSRALQADHRFDEALGNLDSAIEELGQDPALLQMRSEIEAEKRESEAKGVAVQAQTLLDQGEFQTAAQILHAAAARFPPDEALSQLITVAEGRLREQERAGEIAALVLEAEGQIQAKQFTAAIDLVNAGLQKYGPESSLIRAREAALVAERTEREAVLAEKAHLEALAETRRLRDAGDLKAALRTVDAALRSVPADRELQELKRSIESDREKQRRAEEIRKMLRGAQHLLRAERIEPAVEALREAAVAIDKALKKFSDDPGLIELKRQIESEQEAARRAGQQRVQAISAIAQHAISLANSGQFAEATDALDKGLRRFPGAEQLLQASKSVQAEKERADALAIKQARERQQAIAEVRGKVGQLRAEGQLQAARNAIDAALVKFSDDAGLIELKTQILAEMEAEQRARQERAQAVRDIEQEAERLAANGEFSQAADALEAGLAQYPGAEQLIRARESVRIQKDRVEALAEARRLHGSGDFPAALRVVCKALEPMPADRELQDLKGQIESDQEKQERTEEIAGAIRGAQDLLRTGGTELAIQGLHKAAEELETALMKFDGDTRLLELKEQIGAELEAARSKAISEIEEQAGIHLKVNATGRALQILDYGLKRYPGDERLVRTREEALKRRSQAVQEAAKKARAMLDRNALGPALNCLYQDPELVASGDARLTALLAEIEIRRDEAVARSRELHAQGRFAEAHEELLPALEFYLEKAVHFESMMTAEDRAVVELQRQIETDRQHEEKLENAQKEIEALLLKNRPEDAIALLETRFSGEPRFRDLLARARNDLNAKRRDALLESAAALRQERQFAEALRVAEQAIHQYGSTPEAVEIQRGLQEELELQQRREARDRTRDELLAIERRVPETRRYRLKGLADRAQRTAAAYGEDEEITQIAIRIRAQVEATLSTPPKQLPWRWIAGGAGAAALLVGGFILGPRLFHSTTTPKPPITAVAVEIRTDPRGAAVRLGQQSCVDPNCRFELKPGPYTVEARLKGYQPLQQSLRVNPSQSPNVVELTLQPELPPPAPPPQPGGAPPARGTLLVKAGVPEALVIVDNVPQGRTDSQGEFRVPVEAKNHEVRVEKSGYLTTPEQRVRIAAGRSHTALFNLVQVNAMFELRGAPAGVDVLVRGTNLGRTNASRVFTVPVRPGDGTIEVRQGDANRKVTRRFEPGQTLVVDWSSVAPSPRTPQVNPADEKRAREAKAWEPLRNSTDIAALERFLQTFSDGAHASEARQKVQQLTAAREQAARDQAAREQTAKEQAAREQAAREEAARQQTLREQAARELAEKQKLAAAQAAQGIRAALDRFNTAFQHRRLNELKQIWPSARSPFTESVKVGGVTLRATGDAQVGGETASIDCELITTNTVPVKVLLQKQGDHWLIAGLTAR